MSTKVNSPSTETKNAILIVEDEKPMSKALTLKFENSGFTVTSANNGKEALSILKKEKFDVILLDLIMPQMDGFGFMEEFKKTHIKTPVFILTNLSQDEDKKRLEELGAHDFFIKSDTSIKTIVDSIQGFLAK